LGDGLIYREAFTTTAADEAVAHLVNACGLKFAPEAEPGSALPDALPPGKIVFVYRRAAAIPATPSGDDATFHKFAA
jgi:hypothetical protein